MNKSQIILTSTIIFHIYTEDSNLHLRFMDTSEPIRTSLPWIEMTIKALFPGHEVDFIKINGKLYISGSQDELLFAPDEFGFYPVIQSIVRKVPTLKSVLDLYCEEDLDMSALQLS